MVNLIGGTGTFPRASKIISGTPGADNNFGDPNTTGNVLGVTEIGGALSTGKGGDDRLSGLAGADVIFGDAWQITGLGIGGSDRLDGGDDNDTLIGDARDLLDIAQGGNDTLFGGG